MKQLIAFLVVMLFFPHYVRAEIIGTFGSSHRHENRIALTFDACETVTPSHFDEAVLGYLVKEKIPFTLFVSGKFLQRNRDRVAELAKLPFVEIANHSMNHELMDNMTADVVTLETESVSAMVEDIAGYRPRFFRFPAGVFSGHTEKIVEALGYRIVHWSFPSGDADRSVTPARLTEWVRTKAKGGDVLIFHINGRGYSTGEALPGIVEHLKKKGLVPVLLRDAL